MSMQVKSGNPGQLQKFGDDGADHTKASGESIVKSLGFGQDLCYSMKKQTIPLNAFKGAQVMSVASGASPAVQAIICAA